MIKHIVFWKLKPESKEQHTQELKRQFEALIGNIPGMVSLEASANQNREETAADFVLVTQHLSWDDLRLYQAHPDHQKVGAYLRSIVEERWAIDYEVL